LQQAVQVFFFNRAHYQHIDLSMLTMS